MSKEFTNHEKVAMMLFGWNQRPSEVWNTEWYTDHHRFDSDCLYSTPPDFSVSDIMDAMAERGWRGGIETWNGYVVNCCCAFWRGLRPPRKSNWYFGLDLTRTLEAACASALESVERKDE